MRAHYLQHVPFEGLGSIAGWLETRGATTSVSRLHESPTLPSVSDFDWLVVMGGPMSVNDTDAHPWLEPEKQLVADAVIEGKVVLGVCLGAQLIAAALGRRVYPNREAELGWFPVRPTTRVEGPLSEEIEAFHWHGETFDLPEGARLLMRSEACENQAFLVGDRVLGLQFHMEMTPDSAAQLARACRHDLVPARWIQSEREILGAPERFAASNAWMARTLDWLARAAA